ncbi:putative cation efflux system protein [Crocosphaera subtropica ATCC 51142]|uniref:Cation efflux system protein n=1 Tax=Crocosphaera subtropica (strain ATCC 51142 / BH68) TaxID=43989 RepID=B1X0W9_CROS5|nr:cation diffusion facilitator family transporter [Crocosphaera subtropica]ACB53008.1 putative cation efflux system protein [Crocosphaera subtropica ATCC 51142]
MSEGSTRSIYAAMIANVAIGVAKFIGAAISGSSAMLSEGIHSVVDSINEVLLLYGLKQSQKEPDENHPLGHSQEIYFWSLMVAVLIFALGGGISIYEGFKSFNNPKESTNAMVSYGVLCIAALFEGTALLISLREFNKERSDKGISLWQALERSKNPANFVVIFEDSAALLGIAVAFSGVFVSDLTGKIFYDGLASILIGVILTIVAIVLVGKTRGLLVGESAAPQVRESIRNIVLEDKAVLKVESPITFQLGPNDILLALNIEFQDDLSSDQIESAICRIEDTIRASHGEVKRIFIEARSITCEHKS